VCSVRMNVEIIGRLRPTVASDRALDAGGLASNAGSGYLSAEGSQRLVNILAGNSFTYASVTFCIGMTTLVFSMIVNYGIFSSVNVRDILRLFFLLQACINRHTRSTRCRKRLL